MNRRVQIVSEPRFEWFLAQHKPNAHLIAERNLARQGFEAFAPRYRETRRFGQRFRGEQRPLFPGYIFVLVDMKNAAWPSINSTVGITRLVAFGGGVPARVPSGLVSALKARCDKNGLLVNAPEIRVGDAVRIIHGPFADFIATVEEFAPDRRVWVLFDLMGRQARVAVAPDAVIGA